VPGSGAAVEIRARARADLLRRLERCTAVATAYARALELTENGAERAYLERRLAEVQARQ